MFIADVCMALQGAGVRFAIVGGYAVSLHGAVRPTAGVDIAIKWSEKNAKRIEKALTSLNLDSVLPVDSHDICLFRDEYVRNRGQYTWRFADPHDPARVVAVCLDYDLPQNKVKPIETRHGSIPILKRRALIKMKRASGRVQDLQDADALVRLA